MLVRTAHTDRPALGHGQGHFPAVVGLQGSHGLRDIEGAALDIGDGTAHLGGHHDLVEHHSGLLDGADDIAADDLGTGSDHGIKVPLLLPVQGRNLHTAGDVGAYLLHDLLQRTLDTVVDALDHAGAQLHAHGGAGGDHLGTGAQARGLLVNLDGGGVALHGQDLTDQPLRAHANHVGHIGVRQARGNHQRSGYFHNFSAQIDSTFFQDRFARRNGNRSRRSLFPAGARITGCPRPQPARWISECSPVRSPGNPPVRGSG